MSTPTNTPAVGESPSRKGLAVSALVLSIVAIVFAAIPFVTFGAGIFILAALIVSIIAVSLKAGSSGQRITALILSIVAIPVNVVMWIITVGLLFATAMVGGLSGSLVEVQVQQGIKDQTGQDVTVTCPTVITGTPGSTFTCDANGADGSSGIVLVTITGDGGSFTWELQ